MRKDIAVRIRMSADPAVIVASQSKSRLLSGAKSSKSCAGYRPSSVQCSLSIFERPFFADRVYVRRCAMLFSSGIPAFMIQLDVGQFFMSEWIRFINRPVSRQTTSFSLPSNIPESSSHIYKMAKTLVLITGGNNGLGYFACQQMAATGKYHILMGSRDMGKAQKAIEALRDDNSVKVDPNDIEPVQIEVTSDDSINAAASTVEKKYGHLDILMVNAGVAGPQQPGLDGPSLRGLYQHQYNTNLFGAAVTVEAFLPLLRKSKAPDGKRIAFTSSGLSSLQHAREFDGLYSAKHFPIYRSTKTAMNMIMLSYAKLLEQEGFVVSASDPGYCSTDFNRHSGDKDPREGAKVLIRAATESKEKVHGWLVTEDEILPW